MLGLGIHSENKRSILHKLWVVKLGRERRSQGRRDEFDGKQADFLFPQEEGVICDTDISFLQPPIPSSGPFLGEMEKLVKVLARKPLSSCQSLPPGAPFWQHPACHGYSVINQGFESHRVSSVEPLQQMEWEEGPVNSEPVLSGLSLPFPAPQHPPWKRKISLHWTFVFKEKKTEHFRWVREEKEGEKRQPRHLCSQQTHSRVNFGASLGHCSF